LNPALSTNLNERVIDVMMYAIAKRANVAHSNQTGWKSHSRLINKEVVMENPDCGNCEYETESSQEHCGSCDGTAFNSGNWKEAGWIKDKKYVKLKAHADKMAKLIEDEWCLGTKSVEDYYKDFPKEKP